MTLPSFLIALIGLISANVAIAATPPPLYRDASEYPPYSLSWMTDTNVQKATAVYPHPSLLHRTIVATESGLLLSEDNGRAWNELPGAVAGNLGPISDLAFHPILPDTFYVASQSKGVWMTNDNGKTFTQLGSKAKGMAADKITSLIVYSGDASHQTLLAAHGDAAPGLSRSRDGGQTWDVINTNFHFTRLFGGEAGMARYYLFGSTIKEPDIQSVYTANTVGEFITEVVRDVVPTDLVFAPFPWRQDSTTYLTTSDSGFYAIDNTSTFGMAYTVTKLPYSGVDGWASVGATWGPTAEALHLFLYDPTKTGLLVATQKFSNPPAESTDLSQGVVTSDGLPVSALTKQGALLRPNANGTVCYAVANGAISIGRAPAEVPDVNFSPAAFEVRADAAQDWSDLNKAFTNFSDGRGSITDGAKALCRQMPDLEEVYHRHQIHVTARVPVAKASPKSVTIDLSRYGGLPDTLLFDDGQHDDGATGDGLYATTFLFLPGVHQIPNADSEWRAAGPGRVALGLVATYADGVKQGAVGVVNYFNQLLNLEIWHDGVGSVTTSLEGGATVEPFLNPLAPGQPAYAPRLHKGDVAVRLKIPKGPWKIHLKMPYNRHDIGGYPAISLFLRLDDGVAPKELYVQLLDEPEFSPATTTDRVPILNGVALNKDYQRLSLPISQLLGSSPVQTDHLTEIILSGETDAPATLVIDGLAAIPTYPPPPLPPEPSP